MDNIIIRNRKEEFKELVLYTVFGNMTFVISIGSYAIFNVFFGINELIANALAWVFAVLFSYVTNKKWVFKVATPTKTAFFSTDVCIFFSGRFITLVIEEAIIFIFIYASALSKHVGKTGSTGGCGGAQLCDKQAVCFQASLNVVYLIK